MKKILLIFIALPMIGFGQCISGDCENGYGEKEYDDAYFFIPSLMEDVSFFLFIHY